MSDLRQYVAQVLAGRTRAQRRAALQAVPWHLREKVKAEVEHRWRTRRASTGSR